MDRSFNDIQDDILNAKSQASQLNALQVLTTSEQAINSANSTSKVAIWRLWVWIFSFVIWTHEKIVSKNAENSRPQNLPNFKAAIMNFHDGLQLVWKDGSFVYDLANVADAELRKIIKRCAVIESDDGELVVKIATENNGALSPVAEEQKTRILAYLKQIKVPGIPIRLINETPDLLKLNLTAYVDVQIIDLATGRLLNTTEEVYPARDAINSYLSKLEFNGAFVTDFFKSEIKSQEGIYLAAVNDLKWKYASFPFTDINEWQVPEAGYFKINDSDLTINYLPYGMVNS